MDKLFLYNTLGRKKEEFKPIKKGKVSFYYCGPTVYWIQHIGNLRGSVCADLAGRVFEYNGYKVKLVRNYTDVGHLVSDEDEGEDKIEKAAKREGINPLAIAAKYIAIYERDTRDLNVREPWKKPRATGHIKEMQAMVKILLKKGFAYVTPLAIYFDVSKFPGYIALSGQKLEENIIGDGRGNVFDSGKKHPRDFALWFFRAGAHKNALQFWKSPFKSPLAKNGEGFPGWHIECSAMAGKYLGKTVDVHMGGVEHIPVHHTNEIAQSESANGKKFVNYWLHNEHLLANNEKMAKSKGTGFSLAELKKKNYKPLALRYFFLQANYRNKQNFTWEALKAAQNGLNHLYNQTRELGREKGKIKSEFKEKFIREINNDLGIPNALAVIWELLKSNSDKKDKLATLLDFDRILGLDLAKQSEEKEIPAEIKSLLAERQKVRSEGNWPESDRRRKEIEGRGYIVKDKKEGTDVYKK